MQVNGGAYSQVYVSAEKKYAVKKCVDTFTVVSAFFLLREGLLMKHGLGPKLCGILVRPTRFGLYSFRGYIMEFVDFCLQRHQVQNTGYFLDVAQSLDAMHSLGVVHGDIKPANILISAQVDSLAKRKAFLSDFGLSGYASNCGPAPGQFLDVLYTPPFRAPELLFGSLHVECSADVWALGITMYVSLWDPKCSLLKLTDTKLILDTLYDLVPPDELRRARLFSELNRKQSKPQPDIIVNAIVECLNWNPKYRARAKDIIKVLDQHKPEDKQYDTFTIPEPLEGTQVLSEAYFMLPLERTKTDLIDFKHTKATMGHSFVPQTAPKHLELIQVVLKNLCTLLHIEPNQDLVSLSCEFLEPIEKAHHDRQQNCACACVLALYTVRESTLLKFEWIAKVMNTTFGKTVEYLDDALVRVLLY